VWRRARAALRILKDWDNYVRRAASTGIEPLLILDYGNKFYDDGDKPRTEEGLEAFARYAEFVVRNFKGVVHDTKSGTSTTSRSAERRPVRPRTTCARSRRFITGSKP
jgi:hypothetical protein